jgi:RNA-directed DNA polymerase
MKGGQHNRPEGRTPASIRRKTGKASRRMPEKANGFEDKVSRLQKALYQAAKRSPNRRFHALYDKIFRMDVLRVSWSEVRANRGSGGVDGQSIEGIEEGAGVEAFLGQVQEELRRGRYQPQAVRRVEIPKPDGGSRPLGIPTVKDRVVQAACRKVIEPIFEADFQDCSHGFRPGRGAQAVHQGIGKDVYEGHNWVVDGDIRKYFDMIDQEKLMKLVELRISDRKVLKLIRGWLKAGVLMKDGRKEPTDRGTPQGGVISPLLSNIYLNLMDRLWCRKYADLGKLYRYADDFVILCRRKLDANTAMVRVKEIMGRLGLELHPDKTRLVDMGRGREGFDFLGFHYRKKESRKRRGAYWCMSWPSKKAMKKIARKVKETCVQAHQQGMPMKELALKLNPMIRGWVNYFKAGNSSQKFSALDRYVHRRLKELWCRRHQCRKFPAEAYWNLGVYRASAWKAHA